MTQPQISNAKCAGLLLIAIFVFSLSLAAADDFSKPLVLDSPNGLERLIFRIGGAGNPIFEVAHRGLPVADGNLGLQLASSGSLGDKMRIRDIRRTSRDQTYAIPVGKVFSADAEPAAVEV